MFSDLKKIIWELEKKYETSTTKSQITGKNLIKIVFQMILSDLACAVWKFKKNLVLMSF